MPVLPEGFKFTYERDSYGDIRGKKHIRHADGQVKCPSGKDNWHLNKHGKGVEYDSSDKDICKSCLKKLPAQA